MTMAKVLQLVSLGLALLTAGCAPTGPVYTPPPVNAASQPATIAGVSQNLPSVMQSSVIKIDDVNVRMAGATNTTPIALAPGWHDVTVMVGLNPISQGSVDFFYKFGAGTAYTVQFAQPTKLKELCLLTSAWMADPAGKPVTPRQNLLIQLPPPMAAGMAGAMFGVAGALVEAAVTAPMECPATPPVTTAQANSPTG